ncbi:U3 snoRNP protein [Arachnomyces sp. PD_36]|nr:U3 snoRNP protein [Arachnomyces sp. PD_36]
MSSVSDKARFFLEQSVPELKEYEKKKIFTKDEISSIAKRRSDFEHKINARGSQPADFARYAEYEMNLDTLRKKRIKRLSIKSPSHSGQKRIFFVLDRATRKFHGDIGLWMQYIEYARRQKAHKKLSMIFTNVLRLHPTKGEMWIYAAQYALEEHADMTQARSYMQRGLRFSKASRTLWLQYAKLEMIYIAKIAARQQILGLDKKRATPVESGGASLDDVDADMITLPTITGEDINPSLPKDGEVDHAALENLNSTPALSGAIPMVIFDSAMKQFDKDPVLAQQFYEMIVQFEDTPCAPKILSHIVDQLLADCPNTCQAQICHARVAVAGIRITSADFPAAFGESLSRLREYMGSPPQNTALALETIKWLRPLVGTEGLDPALHTVMVATIRSNERVAHQDVGNGEIVRSS